MEDFNIELAGIPFKIRCKHQENKFFFNDYYSTKNPVFTIEPTQETIEEVKNGLDEVSEEEGQPKTCYSDIFLENNAIHLLVADKLIEYNVLMLHGSSLSIDGEGIIFSAKSGTGKSTHSKFWREVFGSRVQMINDDKPMIRVDEIKVYGTPWNGKHNLSSNTSVPLKAIVKLERSTENNIKPLNVKDSLELLMKQTFISKEPYKKTLLMNLYLKIMEKVSFYRLECNMNLDAAQVAYKGLFDKPTQG